MEKLSAFQCSAFFIGLSSCSTYFSEEQKNNSYLPDMVFFPKGAFVMGSPSDEKGRAEDEKQHALQSVIFGWQKQK